VASGLYKTQGVGKTGHRTQGEKPDPLLLPLASASSANPQLLLLLLLLLMYL
jgi:hypothetical protein